MTTKSIKTNRERGGKAWVTYARPGHPGIHGELSALGLSADGIPYVSASEGFSVDNITRKAISISYTTEDSNVSRDFQAANATFSNVHKKSVSCIDVSSGGLAVSSDSGGNMKIWQTNNGEIRRELSGHYGDVTTCRLFPSGVVVLSGSTDMQLKVWSAETGQCVTTMIGHKGGISDTAIVDRGRNIVSSSRDGTVKLWDCGTSTCLTTFSDGHGIINACSVDTPSEAVLLGTSQHVRNEREVSTEGKLLLVACESGAFQGYGLDSREKIFELECHGAVNCCSQITEMTAVCGTEEGYVTIVDLRNVRVPLKEWRMHRSAILSFASHNQSVVISTGDGSCICLNDKYDTVRDLTGPNCDAVYSIASDGTYVYTACRDAAIRKYRL